MRKNLTSSQNPFHYMYQMFAKSLALSLRLASLLTKLIKVNFRNGEHVADKQLLDLADDMNI